MFMRVVATFLFVLLIYPCPWSLFAQHVALRGTVVSENKLATNVGIQILKKGGNAIDAAVAVGYALAVVNPCCGNIGGGGFMTIHLASGENIFINFREKAPLEDSKNMYLNKGAQTSSIVGYLTVAVPGTVLGLDTALQKYGTMKRDEVMQPAINLADSGFVVTPYLATQLKEFEKNFKQQPNIAAIFMKDGHTLKAGNLLIQTNLAKTLKKIAHEGPIYFYRGPIADSIVKASKEHGGILSIKDFQQYNVVVTQPLSCFYRNYEVISAPPPSSGGITLCEMLNILEPFPLQQWGKNSYKTFLVILNAMRAAYYDRNTKLGDPDFVNNPISQLISKSYAKNISDSLVLNQFYKTDIPSNKENDNTTHYSIVDKFGNAVSVTYTLNGFFGAQVIAGETGFFLNNEMEDFAKNPDVQNKFGLIQSTPNLIAPGKRPLSSTTPTIVFRNGKLFLVIGSPGGPRIITSVLLSLINIIDFNMDLQTAINMPRFHYQFTPDWVDYEPFSITTLQKLYANTKGFYFQALSSWGAVEAIMVDDQGHVMGASDIRRPDGAALSE